MRKTLTGFCFLICLYQALVAQDTKGSWHCIGPKHLSGQTMGLVSALWIDTTDLNFILAGSAAGGLWECRNAQSELPAWHNISDSYDSLCTGVWGIAVKPGTHRNTIYIGTKTATKDLSKPYGAGILRTTDGGRSWSRVGPDIAQPVDCIRLCPWNSNVMMATAGKNIYITDNDWQSFKTIKLPSETTDPNVQVCDIEFAPFSDKKIYICTRSVKDKMAELFVTNDRGGSWENMTHGIKAERIEAAVVNSEKFRDKLYIAFGFADVYVQFFDGRKWSRDLNMEPLNQTFTGTFWNFEFAVNEKDTSIMYISMTEASKSKNGGRTFEKVAAYNHGNTHADVRDFCLAKSTPSGKGDILFLGNDGGISQSAPGVTGIDAWRNVNGYGLAITQFWGLDVLQRSDTMLIAGGAQDNGLFWRRDTVWGNDINSCGDGYDAAVLSAGSFLGECNSPTIIQHNIRTNNNWLLPVPDNYVKEYARPLKSMKGKIYLGHRQLYEYGARQVEQNDYKVKNKTTNIPEIKDSEGALINYCIGAFDICERTMNSACVGFKSPLWGKGEYKGKLWYTKNFRDEKPDWTDITKLATCQTVQVFNWIEIYDVTVDDLMDETIYLIARNVFDQTAGRVYLLGFYPDSAKWIMTDITYNLPAVGYNRIIKEKDSDHLYLATDVGVYFMNGQLLAEKKWEKFDGTSHRLPSCLVTDLQINYETNMLYCSTYARGMWESPLASDLRDDFRYSKPVTIDETISLDGKMVIGKNARVELNEKLFLSKGSAIELKSGASLVLKKDKVFDYEGRKIDPENFVKPGSKGRIVFK